MIDAKKVQEVLDKSKLTKREVCRRSSLSRPTLDKLLKGEEVKVSSLETYARLMNVEIGYFFENGSVPTNTINNIASPSSQITQHVGSSDKDAIIQAQSETIAALESTKDALESTIKAKDEIIRLLTKQPNRGENS
jgi:transcriptional regulator with XRE-family HTH domain